VINLRYLGLDLGTKTLGVSLSDLTKTIASPYTTITFANQDYMTAIEELKKIILNENVSKIILGLPKNMNGSLGFRALETLEFKKMLENTFDIPVVTMDERLTTKEANTYMLEADLSRKKRKSKKDSLAANIILQAYLDKEE
jgi:putative Holliday junction resolvase